MPLPRSHRPKKSPSVALKANRKGPRLLLASLLLAPLAFAAVEGEGARDLLDHYAAIARELQAAAVTPSAKASLTELVEAGRKALGAQPNADHFATVVQSLMSQLNKGSGPELPSGLYLRDRDQAYWSLVAAANGRLEAGRIRHIGAWFERRGARWYVAHVFAGSPADDAGLIRGDEIVTVDGRPFEPVSSFRDARPDAKLDLRYRRLPGEKPRQTSLTTIVESFQESMLRDMARRYRLYDVGDRRKVAHVVLPAANHPELRAALATQVTRAVKDKADAMILDLRSDFGGMDLSYYDVLFGTEAPPPGTAKAALSAPWGKALLVLTNGQTRGGRERLAWLVKRHGRGLIIGERTAGDFRPSRLVVLEPGRSALLLSAGQDKAAKAGPIQGQAIIPDIEIEDSLVYAAGGDAVFKAALNAAAKNAL